MKPRHLAALVALALLASACSCSGPRRRPDADQPAKAMIEIPAIGECEAAQMLVGSHCGTPIHVERMTAAAIHAQRRWCEQAKPLSVSHWKRGGGLGGDTGLKVLLGMPYWDTLGPEWERDAMQGIVVLGCSPHSYDNLATRAGMTMARRWGLSCWRQVAHPLLTGLELDCQPAAVTALAEGTIPEELLLPLRSAPESATAALTTPLTAPYNAFRAFTAPESCYIIAKVDESRIVAQGARVVGRSTNFITACAAMKNVPWDGSHASHEARWGPGSIDRERYACEYARPHGNPDAAQVLRYAVSQGIIRDPSGGWMPALDNQARADLMATCDGKVYGPFCAAHDCSASPGLPDTGCTGWTAWKPGPIPLQTLANAFLGAPPSCPPPDSGCWWIVSREFSPPRYTIACLDPEPPPPLPGPECGNGDCEAGESATSCPADCRVEPPPPPPPLPPGDACEELRRAVEAVCPSGPSALTEPVSTDLCDGVCRWDDLGTDCEGDCPCAAAQAVATEAQRAAAEACWKVEATR